jgi:hypothetical protein
MATKTVTRLTDDIDGSDADTTIAYTFDGQSYEIDLSEKNADEFREALAPYVAASRKVGRASSSSPRRSTSSRSSAPAAADVDPRAVRAWAQENGVEVSPRGRISAKVIEQYRAAQ